MVVYSRPTHPLLNQLLNFKVNLNYIVEVEVWTGLVGTTPADDIYILRIHIYTYVVADIALLL